MRKFDTPTPVSVVLDIPAGRVQLLAADRADSTVEVRPADASKGRDVEVAEQATVEYGDGVLRIGASAKNQYDAGASQGRIHNALKNAEGAAGLNIHPTTAHGDIAARSL